MEMEDLTKVFLQCEIILEHNMNSTSQHIKEANAQFGLNKKCGNNLQMKLKFTFLNFPYPKQVQILILIWICCKFQLSFTPSFISFHVIYGVKIELWFLWQFSPMMMGITM
jgi:hypothetical protein